MPEIEESPRATRAGNPACRDFERIVLVGDTLEDVRAALDSGTGVVGVATGRYTREALHAAGAHETLQDLGDPAAVQEALSSAAR